MTQCPACEANVANATMVQGEIFACPDCGTELEVTATTPMAVALAPQEAEDWGE